MYDFRPHKPGEALRALREHGPLDRMVVTTQCLGCREQVVQPMRWFHEHQLFCACGAQFDLTPFLEFGLFLEGSREFPPEGCRILPEIGQEG